MSQIKYRRILLKVSGEALMNQGGFGIDAVAVLALAHKIKTIHELGVQLAVVVGGGNFIRGAQIRNQHIHPATADYMGMMATVMNGIALQEVCESIGLTCRVQSAIEVPKVCEPWIRRRALRHLEKDRVVILAGGTGNPHFTTDTAAAQRAIELNCEALLKATTVDGVYDSDPKKNPKAKRYERLTYTECLNQNLRVMDATAFALCREHGLPIVIMSMEKVETMVAAIHGEKSGTIVGS